MCSPLYTSEQICGHNPKWTKIDICSSIGSAKGKFNYIVLYLQLLLNLRTIA